MEKHQELEWTRAQKIVLSLDLVAAAKQQLQFLAEIDRHRQLYDGPALNRAIFRYKYCWLPLLAKHVKSQVSEGPLVVPLDCEWIWHCHRLNPVRYKNDCKELYGIILDSKNVVSSTQATCKKPTEEIWKRTYPNEPYELDLNTQIAENDRNNILGAQNSTQYDLVSAVKRQIPFYYQVLRPHMNDDSFLEGAVARYKGFLHLIKRNQERSISQFCVPTYDIDLIWHSHQLHPISYCKDLVALIGRVLQHDDTDSDRSIGKKLNTGFTGTTKQWEETFGSRYWRAGAMYRGSAPSPLTINASELSILSSKAVDSNEYQSMIKIPNKMLVEVMLEIVGIRGLPTGEKGKLLLTFSKRQTDKFFNGKRRLYILPEAETGEKQVTVFQCEPVGDIVCELVSYSPCLMDPASPPKVLGTTSISLQDLMKPGSSLSIDKWFEFMTNSQPINLHIALSSTPPVPGPFILRLVKTHEFLASSFLPPTGRFQQGKGWTSIVDEVGNEIMCLQIRDSMKVEAKEGSCSKKEIICMTTSGDTHVIGKFAGTGWSLINCSWWFQLLKKSDNDTPIFEFTGHRKLVIFPGGKLEYEFPSPEKYKREQNSMTAVEFSAECPYGKAVALFDLKSGFLKVKEEWLVFPGILLAFLLSDTSEKEGDADLCNRNESTREKCDASKPKNNSNMEREFSFEPNRDENIAEKAIEVASYEPNGCEHCTAAHGVALYSVDPTWKEIKKSSFCGGCSSCKGGGCAGCSSCGGGCSDSVLGDIMKSSGCGGCGGCGGGGSCGGRCHGSCSHVLEV